MDSSLVIWVVNVVLIVSAVLLIVCLKGVLDAAKSIPPTINAIAGVAQAASTDLNAVVQLLTTQNYISQITSGVLNYGGSLNVALPDY